MQNPTSALRMAQINILGGIGDILAALPLAALLGLAATLFEKFVGIEPLAYCAWVLFFALDWFTGISAAKARGEKIISARLPQTAITLTVYSILLMSLNILSKSSGTIGIPGLFEFNWMLAVKWSIFHAVLITQLYSILENKRDSGGKLAAAILPIVDMVLSSRLKKFWQALRKDEGKPKKKKSSK